MVTCPRCERLERAGNALAQAYASFAIGHSYMSMKVVDEWTKALAAALAAEPEPPCEVCGGSGCDPSDPSFAYPNAKPCPKCKPKCEVCGGSGKHQYGTYESEWVPCKCGGGK